MSFGIIFGAKAVHYYRSGLGVQCFVAGACTLLMFGSAFPLSCGRVKFPVHRANRRISPGEFPYTRGIYPEMYRSRLWTMRQYAGFGTAEESNRRYQYLLSQGTTGLSVAFDLPTQMGLDSDHPLAAGEVGRVGVAICSLADMERLFDGIRLDEVPPR